MNNVCQQMRYLVKDISQRVYFWPLVSLMFLGFVLDTHSTWLFVTQSGLWEKSEHVVHLFYLFFSPSKFSAGPAIILAMLLSKTTWIILTALGLTLVALTARGSRALFRASFLFLFMLSMYNVYAGLWNYYHYFFAIIK